MAGGAVEGVEGDHEGGGGDHHLLFEREGEGGGVDGGLDEGAEGVEDAGKGGGGGGGRVGDEAEGVLVEEEDEGGFEWEWGVSAEEGVEGEVEKG